MLTLERIDHTTADDFQHKHVDGLLLRIDRGDSGAADELRYYRQREMPDLTDAECAARLKALKARKAADAKARQAQDNPKLTDHYTEPMTPTVVHLTHAVIAKALEQDGQPLPPAGLVTWARAESDDKKAFAYLLELVAKIRAGELKPGTVACIKLGPEHIGATVLPVIDAAARLYSQPLRPLTFIRGALQTQKAFDAAVAEYERNLNDLQDRDRMAPRLRVAIH